MLNCSGLAKFDHQEMNPVTENANWTCQTRITNFGLPAAAIGPIECQARVRRRADRRGSSAATEAMTRM